MRAIAVPTLYWHERRSLTLNFPDKWDVQVYHMNGYDAPRLTDSQIRARLGEAIHSRPLRQLASKKTEVTVIFDDMTRPTQCVRLVPHILNELQSGGISEDRIRFVVALGAHGANNRTDFVKKLGEETVQKFPVYNHNPFGNLTDVGTTKRGTPLQINSEVMACDLKIGIGCIVPHSMAGFTGGGKIILPGVSSMEAICYNHCDIGGECFERISSSGWRGVEGNIIRNDIEEAARLAGLDFKVDVVVNELGEISGLFAGDFVEEWKKGVEIGKRVYSTSCPSNVDVVVANAYLKENQAATAMNIAAETVAEGGAVVLIANAPEGQYTHYAYGKFGKKLGGKLWARPPSYPKKMTTIVYSHYKEKDPLLEIADPEHLIWTRTWTETVEAIKASVDKDKPKVAVFPTACVQVPASAFS